MQNLFYIIQKIWCKITPLQAKSPIRTLDELSVIEVIPSPYFPSVMDRERQIKVADDLHGFHSKSESTIPLSSSASIDEVRTSNEDVGFGKRRYHRCLVVTARARAFLYHQVGIFLLNEASRLYVMLCDLILHGQTVLIWIIMFIHFRLDYLLGFSKQLALET